MEEVRKDNAALLKRIRLSQSPAVPTKRRFPTSLAENEAPSLGGKTDFLSPEEKRKLTKSQDGVSEAKRKRISDPDLDSSMDLFGSPGSLPCTTHGLNGSFALLYCHSARVPNYILIIIWHLFPHEA